MSTAADSVKIACPGCGKQYRVARTSAGKRATCSCGLQFQVPASIAAAARADGAAAATQAATPMCARHPDVPAAVACGECRALVCEDCASPQSDGRLLCSECASEAGETYALAEPAAAEVVGAAMASASPFSSGVPCRQHPEVASVANCRQCAAPICATCDFQFPGGLHYCPACATNPVRSISSVHKAMVIWSMVMAGWVTALMVVSMTGLLGDLITDEVGSIIFGIVITVPGLAGLGLACGGMEKRVRTPPLVWAAVIWNAILAALWLVLCLIGSFMS